GTTQVGTAATYTATAAGSYTVEVTNANNCKATSAATTVTLNAAPAAPAVTASVAYCQNAAAAQLTANGTALKWYADNTTTTALAAAPTPATTATGTINYYVSQTTNGCESARAQIAVTVNALPTATITAGGATSFCNGGSVALTASAGSSYVWKNGTTQVGTGATYTATTAGSYTVEITNANNCKATSAATVVTINTPPAAPAVTAAVAYCQNATATQLTATGTALKWYADNTTTTALSAAPVPATSATGTTNYYVSQTTNGCESARAQIAVTVNALPTATITAGGATSFCNGGSVALTASAGSSYVWKNGTTQVGTGATYTATTAGSYTVEITNANNCKATSAATVITINTSSAAPTVTATVAYCQNETAAQLTATGTALKWYADNTTTTALAAAPTPATTATGTTNYYVSQTTNGCESARAQIAVTVNALPTATITAGGATSFCNGGSVALTASNGSSYVWKNGTTQVGIAATYTATTAGSYTVEVTNANNCKATSAATMVTLNAAPAAPTVVSPVSYCQNETAVQLTATGTGLKWYSDNTTTTALSLAPTPATSTAGTTSYFVSQSTNGCESARAQLDVIVNALPAAVITAVGNTTIANGQTVTLNANTGANLTYKWFNGNTQVGTGSSYTANTAGNYTVEVTNASGCVNTSAITSISTAQNQPSVITITSLTNNANIQGPVTISATVSDPDGAIALVEFLDGGTVIGSTTSQPYTFIWTNPSVGEHTITVRATDVLGGVTTSDPVTITSELTTGIHAAGNTMYGNVYPVPARYEVIVETQVDLTGALFSVTNVLGEEVMPSIQVEGVQAKLNVSGLSEGVYLLMVKKESNILTKKIVVTNKD
ncbi:MAG: Ig-like domain-containing protein, partial [Cytophaga sp.]|uniref:Ig-like domain-containing protein n=1 Tax=Cytophaga sp. TaxID=29535 RepID=UPI003F80B2C9